LIQVVTLLGALGLAVLAAPVSGIEESYGHFAVQPFALSHAPAVEISHAPIAIAQAPLIKEVEQEVSISCSELLPWKQLCVNNGHESKVSSYLKFTYFLFPEDGVGIVPKRGCLLTLAYYAFP
jgi:hypothetical protein